jgi:hypothetical protein
MLHIFLNVGEYDWHHFLIYELHRQSNIQTVKKKNFFTATSFSYN